jgi:hypothetical protein
MSQSTVIYSLKSELYKRIDIWGCGIKLLLLRGFF